MYKTDASPLTLVYSPNCRGSKDLLMEQKCFSFPLVMNNRYIIPGECGFVMPALKAHNSKPPSCSFGQRSPFIGKLVVSGRNLNFLRKYTRFYHRTMTDVNNGGGFAVARVVPPSAGPRPPTVASCHPWAGKSSSVDLVLLALAWVLSAIYRLVLMSNQRAPHREPHRIEVTWLLSAWTLDDMQQKWSIAIKSVHQPVYLHTSIANLVRRLVSWWLNQARARSDSSSHMKKIDPIVSRTGTDLRNLILHIWSGPSDDAFTCTPWTV